jgi:hypothetical protein
MPSFSVTFAATVSQRSEIPEGLVNYPVYVYDSLQIHSIVEYGFSGLMMRTHKNNKLKSE